ncbi:hypothetical protein [Neptunomonas qingdaonensis]|uniref:Uncharacterized protein n=1 Tax=Neptunomonas qingdaonensis TaxID=1045558 RepID=A0A1I2REV0_9GAMM|nr:hypothetical protein [Neptunomonas qingdaonensis]SFG38573.1 hypothetical protein SAMN05216175_10668 [Neptunomonas qingdaonensis]
MFNTFSFRKSVKKSSVPLIFSMSFFISHLVAAVEIIATDVPVMLTYKHDITPTTHVRALAFDSAFQIIDRQSLASSDAFSDASLDDSGDMPVWKKGYNKAAAKEKIDLAESEKKSEKVKNASVLELIYFIQMIQKGNQ